MCSVRRSLGFLATIVVLAGVGLGARAARPCGTPIPSAPAFAAGNRNTLRWSQPYPPGGGYVIEVARSPTLDPDGSFKDSNISIRLDDVSSSRRDYTFTGLAERKYHYHLQAKERPGSCTASPFSVGVATIQDATPPTVTIATPEGRVYVPIEPVTIQGAAADAPGPIAPSGSGVASVSVSLANTTPVLGPMLGQPPRETVGTAPDGTWAATFATVQPGTYLATATSFDAVGHRSESVAISIIVLRAPS